MIVWAAWALSLFAFALGFGHGRDGVRPLIEWWLLYASAIPLLGLATVFLGNMAVPLLNPYPLQLRERVSFVNGTAHLVLNVTRTPEAAGRGYLPSVWWYIFMTILYAVAPAFFYMAGYLLGARIEGVEVHFIEEVKPKVLRVRVYGVECRQDEIDTVVLGGESGG